MKSLASIFSIDICAFFSDFSPFPYIPEGGPEWVDTFAGIRS